MESVEASPHEHSRLTKLYSGATYGVSAYIVDVETHISTGFPGFDIVGLPDTAIRESRARLIAAIRNCSFAYPVRKITVNLAPADVKKEGSSFDLPMALGLLASSDQLDSGLLHEYVMVGELALDGTIRPVHGVLPIALEVRNRKFRGMLVPRENGMEAAMVEGIEVHPLSGLREAVEFLRTGRSRNLPLRVNACDLFEKERRYTVDFSDVRGQENVKRALEVAAAGGHHALMVGPPGSGKTMLAKRLPTILPPMSMEETLETTTIHSVAGLLKSGSPLVSNRPFRSPHHTISNAALVGGGLVPRPGEISLAHHGVLFLDEIPEFARNVLEVLRQPLEEGCVTISRTRMTVEYPARFMLVCAMNPCPCGYYTDPGRQCGCTPVQIQNYLSKVSGPLLDRIDLHIEVPPVKYRDLAGRDRGEGSRKIRERVVAARSVQIKRFEGRSGFYCNADMQSRDIQAFCTLDGAGQELLKAAISNLGLSARAYDRILKVGRTIADMAGSLDIRAEHISEAIQYRSLDRDLPS